MANKRNPETRLYRDVFPNSARYMAINTAERTPGMHPAAEINMDRGYYEYNTEDYDVNDKSHSDYLDEGTDQMRLFNVRPAKISYAFSDHSLRSRVPTLLGMVINDAKAQGFGLTYDEDLTPHSSRLSQKGLEKGVLVRNPNNPHAQGDEYGREHLESYEYLVHPRSLSGSTPASPTRIAEGRATIRGLVSGSRTHMSPQFDTTHEQLKLPGF